MRDANLPILMDFEETRKAYLRALGSDTTEDLQRKYETLKVEHSALQHKHQRVLDAVQDSIDAILRIAREGKTEL